MNMTIRRPLYLSTERGALRDRWLISYADVVTILLILFISVAVPVVRPPQTPATSKPAAQPLKAPAPPPDPHAALRAVEQQLREQGLNPQSGPRGLIVSLPQAILFDSADARIKPEARPTVARIAAILANSTHKIVLVGHADNTPIHNRSFKNNWELSAARSLALLDLLVNDYGIPESRMAVESDGSYHPRDSNDTASGRAANRSVEILILDN